MFGVHGNGLSHQLWMKPGSGVLEVWLSFRGVQIMTDSILSFPLD